MNDRKIRILEAVVNDYIDSGSPVSSSQLYNKIDLGVSPATIRSDLAKLEEHGYLTHPHTSSGRVPTDLGYRFYVDRFISGKGQISQDIVRLYQNISGDLDIVLRHTADILSDMTSCCCMIYSPKFSDALIKMIRVMLVSVYKILVVIKTESGVSKDFILDVDREMSEEDVSRITGLFNNVFVDKSFDSLASMDISDLLSKVPYYKGILEKAFWIVSNASRLIGEDSPVVIRGRSNLINSSEFSDIESLRGVVECLDQEKVIADLIAKKATKNSEVSFSIGVENEDRRLVPCTIANLDLIGAGESSGKLVLVGPRRMRYHAISNAMKSISHSLKGILGKDA